MKTRQSKLSITRLKRLRAQGYVCENDQLLSEMAVGVRFPYQLCVVLIIIAMAIQSIPLFAAMMCISFFGVVLPKHPFDYVYNYTLSIWLNKPQLPRRSNQLKFACTIATLWLGGVIALLTSGAAAAGLSLAGGLAITAALPAATDFCVPSAIYNALFLKKGTKASTSIS